MKPILMVAFLALSSVAGASPPSAPTVAPAPAASTAEARTKADHVISQIHQIDQMEIAVGRLAQRKGTTGDIKRYGLLLERDHRTSDKLAMSLAADQNLKVAILPNSPEEVKTIQELYTLRGKAFDQAFLKAMDAGHQKALGMLTSAQDKTGDSRLDGLIGRLVPILEQHKLLSEHLQTQA